MLILSGLLGSFFAFSFALQIAIYGHPFYRSAKDAFSLIVRNVVRQVKKIEFLDCFPAALCYVQLSIRIVYARRSCCTPHH